MQCCLVLVVPVSAFGCRQWHEVQCIVWAPCWDRVQGECWSRGGECNRQGFGEDANCVGMTIVRDKFNKLCHVLCHSAIGVGVFYMGRRDSDPASNGEARGGQWVVYDSHWRGCLSILGGFFKCYMLCVVFAAKCTLNSSGRSVCPLQALEELWRGKKDAFGLRLRRAASNVHFQSNSRKVVINQFHSALHVLPRAKWECTVINIEALQYFVCGEFFYFTIFGVWIQIFPSARCSSPAVMTLRIGMPVFFSFEFKGLGKGCHEEQEEDRRHVVPLTDSYTLWDLFDLIFNLQHAGVIVIDLLDGICKFRGGAISAYDIDQQLVICGIICFDEVDKANIRC